MERFQSRLSMHRTCSWSKPLCILHNTMPPAWLCTSPHNHALVWVTLLSSRFPVHVSPHPLLGHQPPSSKSFYLPFILPLCFLFAEHLPTSDPRFSIHDHPRPSHVCFSPLSESRVELNLHSIRASRKFFHVSTPLGTSHSPAIVAQSTPLGLVLTWFFSLSSFRLASACQRSTWQ